jgi:hypothetical protein
MRRVVIIPLLVCVLFGAIPGAFAQEVQPPKTGEDNGYSQIAIFAKALELVRQDYVDENKTSYHSCNEGNAFVTGSAQPVHGPQ